MSEQVRDFEKLLFSSRLAEEEGIVLFLQGIRERADLLLVDSPRLGRQRSDSIVCRPLREHGQARSWSDVFHEIKICVAGPFDGEQSSIHRAGCFIWREFERVAVRAADQDQVETYRDTWVGPVQQLCAVALVSPW